MHVVVADPEQPTKAMLQARYLYLGWRARFAESAEEAMRLLETETPDVLITEIQLLASNGYELLRNLRKHAHPRLRRLPALVLSHRGQPQDISLGLNAGADDYVVKPLDLVTLEERLLSMATRRRQATGGSLNTPEEAGL